LIVEKYFIQLSLNDTKQKFSIQNTKFFQKNIQKNLFFTLLALGTPPFADNFHQFPPNQKYTPLDDDRTLLDGKSIVLDGKSTLLDDFSIVLDDDRTGLDDLCIVLDGK